MFGGLTFLFFYILYQSKVVSLHLEKEKYEGRSENCYLSDSRWKDAD